MRNAPMYMIDYASKKIKGMKSCEFFQEEKLNQYISYFAKIICMYENEELTLDETMLLLAKA